MLFIVRTLTKKPSRTLDNIGTTDVCRADWNLLMERRISINPPGHESFKDAVHLYPTNVLRKEYNTKRLAALRLPIELIEAEHNNSTALVAP